MADNPPPAKRVKYVAHEPLNEGHITKNRRYDSTQTFHVLLGPEKKRFTVYHDMLTDRSGFFKAARSSHWTEDPQTPTKLTDHNPETFTNYLQLIYGGGCIQPDEELTQYAKTRERIFDTARLLFTHYKALSKLYVLADKLEDLESANVIMDAILLFGDEYARLLHPALTKFVHDSTPPDSPLRNIVRDTIVHENAGKYFLGVKFPAELPHELLLDVAKEHHHMKFEQAGAHGTFANVYNKRLSDFPKCRYHQRNDDHQKCK